MARPDPASLNDFTRAIIEVFRNNNDGVPRALLGRHAADALHTVGAKTGKPRLSPLAYPTVDGSRGGGRGDPLRAGHEVPADELGMRLVKRGEP